MKIREYLINTDFGALASQLGITSWEACEQLLNQSIDHRLKGLRGDIASFRGRKTLVEKKDDRI